MYAEINTPPKSASSGAAPGSDQRGRLVIVCDGELRSSLDGQAFWSNDLGWVSLDDADRFTALERETLRLPMGGSWVIEDGLLRSAVFQVVGKDINGRWQNQTFETAEELEAAGYRREDRVGGEHLRKELVGKPCFHSLCGPMWGGYNGGRPVIRYETWPAYDILSR